MTGGLAHAVRAAIVQPRFPAPFPEALSQRVGGGVGLAPVGQQVGRADDPDGVQRRGQGREDGDFDPGGAFFLRLPCQSGDVF